MTFPEFRAVRKRVNAAEMERAGVTPNEQTQSGWLYPGGLLIESTEGWNDEWMGMFYVLVEGREYFTDDLEQLERILYDREYRGERECLLREALREARLLGASRRSSSVRTALSGTTVVR